MHTYFYTPCFDVLRPDRFNPRTAEMVQGSPTKEPGVDRGSGVELPQMQPLGMVVLRYDDTHQRCVIKLKDTTPPLQGWVAKTSAEVLSDYPGLSGVV